MPRKGKHGKFTQEFKSEILDYVASQNGVTTKDVAEHFKMTPQQIAKYLKALVKDGDICNTIVRIPTPHPHNPKEYKELPGYMTN